MSREASESEGHNSSLLGQNPPGQCGELVICRNSPSQKVAGEAGIMHLLAVQMNLK